MLSTLNPTMQAMNTLISIRDARADERDAIRQLTEAAYAEYADIMPPAAWDGLRGAVDAGLDGEPNADRIVAERNGVIVGSVMLCPPTKAAYGGALDETEWPEIRLLAVDRAIRGQGVAKMLIAECEQRTRAAGATAIGLHTSASLRAAIHIYEQLGYNRVPAYDFQPPGAELVMAYRKRLKHEG